jgi:hypothetical protein
MHRFTFPLTLVAFFFVGLLLAHLYHQWLSNNEYASAIAIACKAVNDKCPIMIDSITRVDQASVEPDRVFRYHVTILSLHRYTQNDLELLLPTVKKAYAHKETFKKLHVTCEYDYYNEDGSPIGKLLVGGDR